MGNNISITKKVNYEDIQYVMKNNKNLKNFSHLALLVVTVVFLLNIKNRRIK